MTALHEGGTYTAQDTLGMIEIYTADLFRVNQDVTIRSVQPDHKGAGLELLTTRINFVGRHRGGVGVAGYPGSLCTNKWPPRGFGPSYPASDLQAYAGEELAVTFYVRAAQVGSWSMRGVQLVYVIAGKSLRVTSDAVTLKTEVAATAEGFPQHAPSCNPNVPSAWTGDERAGDKPIVMSS